jgi:2-hydroxy-6-oxonona-2,4-dienedioate hydrolase
MSYQSIWTDLMGVGFRQGYLEAGGVRTRYVSAGSQDQQLLLLLHGVGGHVEAYSRNPQAHAKHFWTAERARTSHGRNHSAIFRRVQ